MGTPIKRRRNQKKKGARDIQRIAADARISRMATARGIPQCTGRTKKLIVRMAEKICTIFGRRSTEQTRLKKLSTIKLRAMARALEAAGLVVAPINWSDKQHSKKKPTGAGGDKKRSKAKKEKNVSASPATA
jgi:hypothetical protein